MKARYSQCDGTSSFQQTLTPLVAFPTWHAESITIAGVVHLERYRLPRFYKLLTTHLHQVYSTLPLLQAALGRGNLVPLPSSSPPFFVLGRQLQREVYRLS
jgi:hypothetical protein